MKALSLIFLFISLTGFSQSTISGTFSGNDMGTGVRYDHQLSQNRNTNHGVYVHAGYGCYRDTDVGEVEHYRASMGYEVILKNYASKDMLQIFSVGISGHKYNQFEEGVTELNHGTNPVSIEFGFGMILLQRLSWIVNYDPLKKDVVVAVGYRFGLYRNINKLTHNNQ